MEETEVKVEKAPVEIQYRTSTKSKLSQAKVDKVLASLKKGRRYFGSSGAGLTHQTLNKNYFEKKKNADGDKLVINPTLAKVGLEGERKTTLVLKEWMKDKPNVVLLDSIHIKGYGYEEVVNEETGQVDGGDTDHVLVIGNIVVMIDSKNWKGNRAYTITENAQIMRSGNVFHSSNPKTRQAAGILRSYLSSHNPQITSIISISSDKVFVKRDGNWWRAHFRLVSIEYLPDFLDLMWSNLPDNTKDFINVGLISDLVVSCIKPYDPVKENMKNVAHLLNM